MAMSLNYARGPPGPPPFINSQFQDGSNNWKWQNLSSSPTTLFRIPNLMWTTIAASVFLGTKSITSSIPSGFYKVRPFDRHITCNFWCGVPTIVNMVTWTALICLTAYMIISARVSLPGMKRLFNRLSGGRAFPTITNPQDCRPDAPTFRHVKGR
jgi:hypothetical protein